ncbi:hypothetical protein GC173_10500 [bacterium]|nr:hypothetical protein [bacterium]
MTKNRTTWRSCFALGSIVLSVLITGCGEDEAKPQAGTAGGDSVAELQQVTLQAEAATQSADNFFDERDVDREVLAAEMLAQEAAQANAPAEVSEQDPRSNRDVIRQPKAPSYPPYRRVPAYKNVRTLEGAQSSVTRVVPIGPNRVMSHDFDGMLRVWETDHGTVQKFCDGHLGEVSDISSDGRLAVVYTRRNIEVVDPWNCVTLTTLRPSKNLTKMRLSPDAQRLAVGYVDGGLGVWDLYAGEEVVKMSGHKFAVQALAWTSGGRMLMSGSLANDPSLRVWDAQIGKELARLEHASQEHVGAIAVSADGRLAATSGMLDVIVWDIQNRQVIQTIKHQVEYSPLCFIDPDGERLAIGNQGTLQVFDVRSGSRLQQLPAHSKINDISVTPDGSRIYTAGLDAMVTVWGESTISNAEPVSMPGTVTARPLYHFNERSGSFTAAAFATDANGAYVGHSQGLTFAIDLSTGDKVREYGNAGGHEVTSVEASRDGKLLAVGDTRGNVTIYEPSSARVVARYEDSQFKIVGLSFFPDSRRLAVAARGQGIVAVVDAQTGNLISTVKAKVLEQDLLVLPDSQRIFVQGQDGGAVLDIADGSVIQTLPGGDWMLQGDGFAGDGSFFVVGGNGLLSTYSIGSSRPRQSVKLDGRVKLARASETGKYVTNVTVGRVDLRDGATLKPIANILVGNMSAIYEVAVHEGTKRVLVAGSKASQADLQVWAFE